MTTSGAQWTAHPTLLCVFCVFCG